MGVTQKLKDLLENYDQIPLDETEEYIVGYISKKVKPQKFVVFIFLSQIVFSLASSQGGFTDLL